MCRVAFLDVIREEELDVVEAKNARLEGNGSSENSVASESELTQLEEERRRILDQLNSTQADEEEEEEEEMEEDIEGNNEEEEDETKEQEDGEENQDANGVGAGKAIIVFLLVVCILLKW